MPKLKNHPNTHFLSIFNETENHLLKITKRPTHPVCKNVDLKMVSLGLQNHRSRARGLYKIFMISGFSLYKKDNSGPFIFKAPPENILFTAIWPNLVNAEQNTTISLTKYIFNEYNYIL